MHPSAKNSPLHQIAEYPAWSHAGGDESAVILTTRVRIARNLVGEHFPYRMNVDGRIRVMRHVARVIAGLDDAQSGVFFSLSALAPIEINLLVERRTISPQLARDENPRGVFTWKDRDRAIMVCEEDHVRLTEIVPGLAPQKAYDNLQPVLHQLSESLDFVTDDELGYLTACPANLGAATRTSLFCHLPALVLSGGMDGLVSQAADAGFTVRGFWGEGSEVLGNTFQFTDGPGLSHQVSDMLSRIESLGQTILEHEAMARIELQSQRPAVLKDKIARALAILKSCRVLSGSEILALFSAMRLGLDIGFIEGLNREIISMLTFDLGKAYMQWTGETDHNPDGRQIRRADRVREVFQDVRFVG
jgi:protein arginine kinase